jgi:hypothetical protein
MACGFYEQADHDISSYPESCFMNKIRMKPGLRVQLKPGRRVLLAGMGYLMVYLSSVWHPQGPISTLLCALLYLAVALVLFKAAAPDTLKPDSDPAFDHPVQAGKQRHLHRNLGLYRPLSMPVALEMRSRALPNRQAGR